MLYNSKIHGEINYEEKDIITFNKGLFGFEDLSKFFLVNLEEIKPFKLLHSLENEDIGMIVIHPFDFFKDYEICLSEETIRNLKIKSENEVLIINTVTLNSNPNKITTNLQGPIIINISNNLGEQIIVDNSKYKVKEPLIKE
ncbi:flagellar assembly protein FliW [Clostridium sp.]|uniref:flagellar assembly protein FliW n=1 Tax=Clostridium sp. TaxID=1506 RepID=UPI00260DF9B8|nr:flagellar assembly protein FliW [Clostridium sp.]